MKKTRLRLKVKGEVARMNLNVPIELHNAFKAACAQRGEQMSEVLLKFIRRFVQRPEETLARLKLPRR